MISITTNTIIEGSPLFETFSVGRNQVPIDDAGKVLDLSGTIMMTFDEQRRTPMHLLTYRAQQATGHLFQRRVDPEFCHAAIVHELSEDDGKISLISADIKGNGIRFDNEDYFKDRTISGILFVRPVDPKLRELLCLHARQVVYAPKKMRAEDSVFCANKKAGYSIRDLLSCWSHRPEQNREKRKIIKRVSRTVADLLLGNQLLDKSGKPKSFFCSAFVTTLLQGTVLVQALNDDQKSEIITSGGVRRDRRRVAQTIANILQNRPEHPLSETFLSHPICELNARYLMTSDAAITFQKLGAPIQVKKRTLTRPALRSPSVPSILVRAATSVSQFSLRGLTHVTLPFYSPTS